MPETNSNVPPTATATLIPISSRNSLLSSSQYSCLGAPKPTNSISVKISEFFLEFYYLALREMDMN